MCELGAWLIADDTSLNLEWVSRDQNDGADRLSKKDFHGFKKELQIPCDLTTIKWKLLPAALKMASLFAPDDVTLNPPAEPPKQQNWNVWKRGGTSSTTTEPPRKKHPGREQPWEKFWGEADGPIRSTHTSSWRPLKLTPAADLTRKNVIASQAV